MEKRGIGRPSTYANTVKTLKDRFYIQEKGKQYHLTVKGNHLVRWAHEACPVVVDIGYTAEMEAGLDGVELGKIPWKKFACMSHAQVSRFLENLGVVKDKYKLDEKDKAPRRKKSYGKGNKSYHKSSGSSYRKKSYGTSSRSK